MSMSLRVQLGGERRPFLPGVPCLIELDLAAERVQP